jgi:hypothetical protein
LPISFPTACALASTWSGSRGQNCSGWFAQQPRERWQMLMEGTCAKGAAEWAYRLLTGASRDYFASDLV